MRSEVEARALHHVRRRQVAVPLSELGTDLLSPSPKKDGLERGRPSSLQPSRVGRRQQRAPLQLQ